METFQDTLFGLFAESFPLKKKIIFSQNEPFINDALLDLEEKGTESITNTGEVQNIWILKLDTRVSFQSQ